MVIRTPAALLLGFFFVTATVPVNARADEPAAKDIVRQYDEIKEVARRLGLDALLPGAQHPDATLEMQAILDRTRREAMGALGAGPGKERMPRMRYTVFASLSLPRGVLVRMLDEARARGDMEVVVRGVPEGETISSFAMRLISTESKEPVPLSIDPVSFRRFQVDVVPAILDRETGSVLYGTFFAERFDHHEPGDTVDRVYEIDEPDLIEVMQARAARIDWASMRQGALDRAWAARPKVVLAKAERPDQRRLDLSFTMPRDVRASDGTVIARAGTRVDPVDHVPFTPTLIVFDGRDPSEIVYAAGMAATARDPILLTTDLGDAAGLDGLRNLSARFDAPVYALDLLLRDRFDLRVTPSVVRAGQGGVMLLEGIQQ